MEVHARDKGAPGQLLVFEVMRHDQITYIMTENIEDCHRSNVSYKREEAEIIPEQQAQ